MRWGVQYILGPAWEEGGQGGDSNNNTAIMMMMINGVFLLSQSLPPDTANIYFSNTVAGIKTNVLKCYQHVLKCHVCSRACSHACSRGCSRGCSHALQVDDAFSEIRERYSRISGVAHCVGSIILKPIHQTSDADFETTLRLNLHRWATACLPASPLFHSLVVP